MATLLNSDTMSFGQVSMSAQWAPFNVGLVSVILDIVTKDCIVQAEYKWLNNTQNLVIPDPEATVLNSYIGGILSLLISNHASMHFFHLYRCIPANH